MSAGEQHQLHCLFDREIRERTIGDVVLLDSAESAHVRVLRLQPGDAVRITDGAGGSWGAQLVRAGAGLGVRLDDRLSARHPLVVDLWAPVGNKQAMLWLVEKATEFGVRQITPVEFERSASVLDAGRSRGFWQKAERRAIAALKQSGGAWLPEIRSPRTLDDCLGAEAFEGPLFVLDRSGAPLASHLSRWDARQPVTLVIGPEGGLTPAEYQTCAAAGFVRAGLAATVLRFETAAVAGLAAVEQRRLQVAGAANGPKGDV
jgi:16S rRNA (uracil1498-N3)-methyltransferase